MKCLHNIFSIIMSLALLSCNTDNSLEPIAESESEIIEKSLIFIHNTLYVNDHVVRTVEIKNFNPNFKLDIEYNIDGVKYTDSGYYNDIKAGDGIYTSVELFSKEVNYEDEYIYVGKQFEYLDDFDLLLIKSYGHSLNEIIEINNSYNQSAKTKGVVASIKIACKIVTRECPEDKWYNKCLFSSPCTCVYLEDCELTIDVGI